MRPLTRTGPFDWRDAAMLVALLVVIGATAFVWAVGGISFQAIAATALTLLGVVGAVLRLREARLDRDPRPPNGH